MASTEIETPSWITPGTKIVVYSTGSGPRLIAVTTIDRVAKLSFTVTGRSERFNLARQDHRHGGTWGSTWHVVPVDSPEGRAELCRERQRRLVRAAALACEAWMETRTSEDLSAAIAALQAVEGECDIHREGSTS